jgi:2'-5' RNA ligase
MNPIMPRHAPVLRLFVAAYPPRGVAAAMLDLLAGLHLPRNRPTPVEQLHMTLQFIGDRHEREVAEVIESVERSAAGIDAFRLTPRSLISLPERGPARLVALETDAPPGLTEIQRRLAHRLSDPARRGKGRFTPHLTLCRFAHEERMERLERAASLDAFGVTEIRLMCSVLRPGGAEHRLIHAAALAENQTTSAE